MMPICLWKIPNWNTRDFISVYFFPDKFFTSIVPHISLHFKLISWEMLLNPLKYFTIFYFFERQELLLHKSSTITTTFRAKKKKHRDLPMRKRIVCTWSYEVWVQLDKWIYFRKNCLHEMYSALRWVPLFLFFFFTMNLSESQNISIFLRNFWSEGRIYYWIWKLFLSFWFFSLRSI